ncbi:MAG TPA: flagellar hook basal-body protein [Vicinamibacterales bacterium]
MAGGAYTALSGLRARMEQLDRLAADIANAGTAGYKTERVPTAVAHRPDFGQVLQTAIDVSAAPGLVDFREGSISPTGRDLDVALEGRGFFEIQTPNGPRYTRNGQFSRRGDGVLVTADGHVVQGENGPITLTAGQVTIEPDGTVRSGETVAGRLRIVDFPDYVRLRREDGARFRAEGMTPTAASAARVRGGALEGSNVSLPERMVQLTEVARAFEALQRGVTTLMNDVDGRAISELGRR